MADGISDGSFDGAIDGIPDGSFDGANDGCADGSFVGSIDGTFVGAIDIVGASDCAETCVPPFANIAEAVRINAAVVAVRYRFVTLDGRRSALIVFRCMV